MEGYQWVMGGGRMGENVQKISINGRYKIDGEVKNSVRNGEAKELICMTRGHELRVGECWWEGGTAWKEIKRKKNSSWTWTILWGLPGEEGVGGGEG